MIEAQAIGSRATAATFDRQRWDRRLAFAVNVSDLTCSAHRMFGGQGDRIEVDRLAVVALLDEGTAAGLSDDEMTAQIAAARAPETGDLA